MANGPPTASWHPALMPESHPLPPAAPGVDVTNQVSPTAPANRGEAPEKAHVSIDTSRSPEEGSNSADEGLVSDSPDATASSQATSTAPQQFHAGLANEASPLALGDAAQAKPESVEPWLAPDGHAPLDLENSGSQEATAPNLQTDTVPEEARHSSPQQDLEDAGMVAAQGIQLPDLPGKQSFQPKASVPVSEEVQQQPTHAQHSSSMSFARTVSHEVSFIDDDDADWDLTRSASDASVPLPLPDRTDSFPDVKPLSAPHHEASDQPLPPTQALDLMQQTGKEVDQDEQCYVDEAIHKRPDALSAPFETETGPQISSQAMGGETQGSEAQDFEACYDEGVPLVTPSVVQTDVVNDEGAETSADPFANDDPDDFFAMVQQPDTQPDDGSHPSIERKSTTEAMGCLGSGPSLPESVAGDEADRLATVQVNERSHQSQIQDVSGSSDARDERDNEHPAAEDATAKWQAIFAEDEDGFLSDDSATGEKVIDPADFLGSDDEGLLDDDGPVVEAVSEPPAALSVSSPYIPTTAASSTSPQFPFGNTPFSSYPQQRPPLAPYNAGQLHGQGTQPRPDQVRVSSFADKSKGGYSSPYDLPSDLLSNTLKPRKRASLQQLPREQAPPPRSTSMFTPGHPPTAGSMPPPTHPSQGARPTSGGPVPVSRNSSSFFEDLPITSRPRPRSRQGSAPQQQSPYTPSAHPMQVVPPPPGPVSPPANRAPPPPGIGDLVAPERVNPYAAFSSPAPPAPPPMGATSRYSPALSQPPVNQAPAPLSAMSRYSPAPPGPRPVISHNHTAPVAPSQAALPHLPRTSSPLAHFEASSDNIHREVPNGDAYHPDRRSNSFDHRFNRVSSLPPTREVDEEEDDHRSPTHRSVSTAHANRPATMESRFTAASHGAAARQTPPPPSRSYGPPASLSPQRTGPSSGSSTKYMPHSAAAIQPEFAPPPRPSTQSPLATQGDQPAFPTDSKARPSSAHASADPALPKSFQSHRLRRGQSLSMNLVPPTDGREHDPLQRWKGTPLLAWGVGGTVVTSFPKSVPRYTMGQTTPTMLRTAGEVKVQNIKEVDPLADQLARFPGPLKGRSKKKEALAWLAAGIDAQEKDLPDISFHFQPSLEAKRGVERLLLWKLLRIFIEFDGALEGSSNVAKAVSEVLYPESASSTLGDTTLISAASGAPGQAGPVTSMMADSADPAAVEQIRLELIQGNRETAVWSAVDKRLWGHAMLISHTVSPDLYKQVAQEFVRKEVNYPGHNNESIAALYKVLSGNFDDCVDELVPIHARVGLQLVSKQSSVTPARDAADGLDKWRETLTLILNNRSSEDARGLNALGKLLSSYGRAEAAQICFIFSRSLSVFGGLDEQKADFVLFGSDHRQQSDYFAKETETLQLSEVYEYGLSLAGGSGAAAGAPHLAAYKFQHAVTLAEYGYRDKALQYCDAIASAMASQTRRSPYHHAILEAAVDDFMTRLKQSPKDASSSWMSKPSMNKVSDSMWNRFNKFVAGEEGDNTGNGAAGDTSHGPFARMTTTPNLSRSPSVTNFESYGGGSPGYSSSNFPPLALGASSRYAPAGMQPAAVDKPFTAMSQYAPASVSSERNSNEYARNAYEPVHPGNSHSPVHHSSGYAPTPYSTAGTGYQAVPTDSTPAAPNGYAHSSSPPMPTTRGYLPLDHRESTSAALQSRGNEGSVYSPDQGFQPSSHGYEPQSMTAADLVGQEAKDEGAVEGYQAPSYQPYGYEPPSYQPDPEPAAEDSKDAPKPKKSFMDDDDDDIPALRRETKTKIDKDRENDEMFHKAAEEDAKRAAAQQSGKKGWGFGGWFGGSKKTEGNVGETSSSPGKPVRAKLGEASSFVYDPELKRWINKKAGAENTEAKKATPPPPRAAPRSVSGTPPPSAATSPPPSDHSSAPPLAGPLRSMPTLAPRSSQESLGLAGAPPMSRSASNSALAAGPPSRPPSRPATSMSNASSIDDLLGSAAPRKPGQKKPRKSGRYVDVMAK